MKELPNTDQFSFRYKDNQELIKYPNSINGQPFIIEELTECDVGLYDVTETLVIASCKNTTIRCGPTKGICRVSNCSDCVLSLACEHIIVSGCMDVKLFLYSASEPELERSSLTVFAPYNLAYPMLGRHFEQAGLEPRKNMWSRVRCDMDDAYGSAWTVLPKEQFFIHEPPDLKGYGEPEDPVPKPEMYGGTVKGKLVLGSQTQFYQKQDSKLEIPMIIYQAEEQPLPPSVPVHTSPRLFSPSNLPVNSGNPLQPPESKSFCVIVYDPEMGFSHASEHESLRSALDLSKTLEDLTELVAPHYQYKETLKLSAYFLAVGALLLYLFIVLLLDFVAMHLAGLIINLIIVSGSLFGLIALVVVKWRGDQVKCNQDLESYIASHQAAHLSQGYQLTATIYQVTVKSLTS